MAAAGDGSVTDEKCDWCKLMGRLGSDIRAYRFVTPGGKSVVRFLHASDGGQSCYQDFDKKYRTWLADERAKRAAATQKDTRSDGAQ
jgi:hypothetical protein